MIEHNPLPPKQFRKAMKAQKKAEKQKKNEENKDCNVDGSTDKDSTIIKIVSKDQNSLSIAVPRGTPIPANFEATFRIDEKGRLIGNDGKADYVADVFTMGKPKEGEIWNCIFDKEPGHIIPLNFLAMYEETPVDSPENNLGTQEVEFTSEIPVTPELETIASTALVESSNDDGYEKEINTLKRTINELKVQNAELSEKLRTEESNNRQLRQTIRNMSLKSKNSSVADLSTKVANKDSEINALKFEVNRLKAFIEANGIDTENISDDGGMMFSTMKTSNTRIHSSAFNNGTKYTVQIGRKFSRIRLIPDDDGTVTCKNGDIELQALGYCKCPTLTKLKTSIERGIITIECEA